MCNDDVCGLVLQYNHSLGRFLFFLFIPKPAAMVIMQQHVEHGQLYNIQSANNPGNSRMRLRGFISHLCLNGPMIC